jgi:hypothetical protein
MPLKFKVLGQVNHQSRKKELVALVAARDVAKVIEEFYQSMWLDVEVKELEDKSGQSESRGT